MQDKLSLTEFPQLTAYLTLSQQRIGNTIIVAAVESSNHEHRGLLLLPVFRFLEQSFQSTANHLPWAQEFSYLIFHPCQSLHQALVSLC